MTIVQIVVLAIIQGLAELLPVSSSAHVIVAEKLWGLDPSSPAMTFLLVMLHTGTMFAVIVYFWKAWKRAFFPSMAVFKRQAMRLIVASALTAVVGYPLMKGIEHVATKVGYVRDAAGKAKAAQIEDLFSNLPLIAISLGVVGVFILAAGLSKNARKEGEVTMRVAGWMGAVQGLCVPFRGFSRSGATISTGLMMGAMKARVEEFSFALAVILTPAAVGKEAWRLIKMARDAKPAGTAGVDYAHLFGPSMLGLALSFLAGLAALKLLSRVLERGRWHWFGIYCLGFAAVVGAMAWKGF